MVLELSTGANSEDDIAEAIADAFQLDQSPRDSVTRCLDELLAAGLITYDKHAAANATGVLVHVCAPQGLVGAELAKRLVELVGVGATEGFSVEVDISTDTGARRARNFIAASVLERQDISHVFFLGHTTPVDVEQFRRVVQSGHDVVSTAPPNEGAHWGKVAAVAQQLSKASPEELADAAAWFSIAFGSSADGHMPSDGYLRADTVPVDGLLVSRDALLRLAASDTVPRSIRQWSAGGVQDAIGYGFFEPMMVNGDDLIDEDVAFCSQWRAVGGDIWVDLSGVFGRSLSVSQRVTQNPGAARD